MSDAIEDHPIYHKWYLRGDIVTERMGRRPLVIERHQRCQYCPTERIDTINVRTWQPVRKPRYKYVRGTKIVRMTKETYLRFEFLKSTDLDDNTVRSIQKDWR
jgi:hypothetical protein